MENQKKMEDYIKIQIQKHKETYDPCNIRDFIDLYIQREYDDTEDDITGEGCEWDVRVVSDVILVWVIWVAFV